MKIKINMIKYLGKINWKQWTFKTEEKKDVVALRHSKQICNKYKF